MGTDDKDQLHTRNLQLFERRKIAPENIESFKTLEERLEAVCALLGVSEETYLLANESRLRQEEFVQECEDKLAEIVAKHLNLNNKNNRAENAASRQSELSAIFSRAVVGLCEIDIDGCFLQVNDELCRMLRRPREELLTLSVEDVTHPDDVVLTFLEFGRLVETGEPVSLDKRYIQADGKVIWANSSLTRLTDDNGTPRSVIAVTVDRTNLHHAEEKLRESEASLANAQRIAHLGSWDWNVGADHLTLSEELCRLFEFPREKTDITLEDCLNRMREEDREPVKAALNAALEENAPYEIEYRLLQKNAPERIIHNIGEVLFDPQGNPVKMSGTAQDVTEQKQAAEALIKSRERLSLAQQVANIGSFEWDFRTKKLITSRQLEAIYEATENFDGSFDKYRQYVHPDDIEEVEEAVYYAIESGAASREFRIQTAKGAQRWIYAQLRVFYDEQKNPIRMFGVNMDVTDRKATEEALRKSEEKFLQSQKLESIGRLAGGIAHDFNNMLTVINGYSEFSLQFLKEGEPLRNYIQEIRKAGERSANLTNQLLAFSRRQIMQPQIISLNQIIKEIYNLLERLIGEDVILTTKFKDKESIVEVDPGQMTQVVMNLAVNARDAMPKGGTLYIETANVNCDEELSHRFTLDNPGDYVKLTVSDTGIGMSEETLEHLFEPFYTTKKIGEGSGLGLSTVYGIVKQSGGYIWAESEPGAGSTLTIYLPQAKDGGSAPDKMFTPGKLPAGTETILIVEDEEAVRELMSKVLTESGYRVIKARSGEEALALCRERDLTVDVLITDVVMPEMSGRELAETLTETHPQMQILYASGYMDDVITRHGITEDGANFIQKPFTPDSLSQKIRQLLNNLRKD